jgi:hypothetical protein
MAISLKNQKVASTKVTGLGQFSVVGFNFNKAQLKELGKNVNEEPQFLATREVTQTNPDGTETKMNVPVYRINVWVKFESPTVTEYYEEDGKRKQRLVPNPCLGQVFKMTFSIENRPWISTKADAKQQFLNAVGKSMWKESVQACDDHFKARTPVYPALRGLAQFYEFLLAWTNIDTSKSDSRVILGENENSIKGLFTGDTSIIEELNSYVEPCKEHRFSALVGVEGDFLSIYSGVVLGETYTTKQADKLYESAVGEWGFKGDFQNNLVLQAYDPAAILAARNQGAVATNNGTTDDVTAGDMNGLGNNTTIGAGNDTDDLPF